MRENWTTPLIQKAILRFIDDYHAANGYAPSLREISDGLGMGSISSCTWQVRRMQEKDLISRRENVARTIALTAKGEEMIGE